MLKKIAIPTMLLMTCLMTVGTLAQDSEIVAKVGIEVITNHDLEVRRKRTEVGKVEEMAKILEKEKQGMGLLAEEYIKMHADPHNEGYSKIIAAAEAAKKAFQKR